MLIQYVRRIVYYLMLVFAAILLPNVAGAQVPKTEVFLPLISIGNPSVSFQTDGNSFSLTPNESCTGQSFKENLVSDGKAMMFMGIKFADGVGIMPHIRNTQQGERITLVRIGRPDQEEPFLTVESVEGQLSLSKGEEIFAQSTQFIVEEWHGTMQDNSVKLVDGNRTFRFTADTHGLCIEANIPKSESDWGIWQWITARDGWMPTAEEFSQYKMAEYPVVD